MRNLHDGNVHFIFLDDSDEVAAVKAKEIVKILGVVPPEVTQRLTHLGVRDIDAVIQVVRENLSEFSEVIVSKEIAANASAFFYSTLYLLGKQSTTEL